MTTDDLKEYLIALEEVFSRESLCSPEEVAASLAKLHEALALVERLEDLATMKGDLTCHC